MTIKQESKSEIRDPELRAKVEALETSDQAYRQTMEFFYALWDKPKM